MELEGAIFVMINKEQAHSYFSKLTQNIDLSDLQKYGEASHCENLSSGIG